jgi:hypothetical protein
MVDLDALVSKTISVRLDGVDYVCPCGLDSMPLSAVVAGKAAQEAIARMAEGNEECSSKDVDDIVVFLSAATNIPFEVLRFQPAPRILALLQAVMPTPENQEAKVEAPLA